MSNDSAAVGEIEDDGVASGVVRGGPYGTAAWIRPWPQRPADTLAGAFAGRPADEPVWSALRQALGAAARESRDPDALRTSVLIEGHPEPRARHLQKRARWTETLTPAVARRLSGPAAQRSLRAASVVGAALACFDAAVTEWIRTQAAEDLDTLLDQAMRSVSDLIRPS